MWSLCLSEVWCINKVLQHLGLDTGDREKWLRTNPPIKYQEIQIKLCVIDQKFKTNEQCRITCVLWVFLCKVSEEFNTRDKLDLTLIVVRGGKTAKSDGEARSWVRCLEYCRLSLNWTGIRNAILCAKWF